MSDIAATVDGFDYGAFAQRIREAIAPEKPTVFANRTSIPTGTFFKYLAANGTAPRMDIVIRIAEGAGVSLDWLLLGRGDGPDTSLTIARVPIYDVRLAAGAASFAEAARRVGDMPFDLQLLKQLGRTSADGLAIVDAEGDSMEPTIPDGARVLLDLHDKRLREGVFGFRFDDELRVKRLRRSGDAIEIISDNPRYRPETIQGPERERFDVIGRVKWIGAVL